MPSVARTGYSWWSLYRHCAVALWCDNVLWLPYCLFSSASQHCFERALLSRVRVPFECFPPVQRADELSKVIERSRYLESIKLNVVASSEHLNWLFYSNVSRCLKNFQPFWCSVTSWRSRAISALLYRSVWPLACDDKWLLWGSSTQESGKSFLRFCPRVWAVLGLQEGVNPVWYGPMIVDYWCNMYYPWLEVETACVSLKQWPVMSTTNWVPEVFCTTCQVYPWWYTRVVCWLRSHSGFLFAFFALLREHWRQEVTVVYKFFSIVASIFFVAWNRTWHGLLVSS